MPKEYPAEFKTKIIKRYQKGESIQSLSQELHIAQSTLYDWRREYCSIKTANRTYTPKEFDTLSRRLEKLEHELEIIRLTGYISNVPLQKSWSSWKASTKSQTTRIVSMSSVKRWMLPAEPSTTTSSAEPTAASAIKSRRGLCGWYSRFLMTVPSDSAPKNSHRSDRKRHPGQHQTHRGDHARA